MKRPLASLFALVVVLGASACTRDEAPPQETAKAKIEHVDLPTPKGQAKPGGVALKMPTHTPVALARAGGKEDPESDMLTEAGGGSKPPAEKTEKPAATAKPKPVETTAPAAPTAAPSPEPTAPVAAAPRPAIILAGTDLHVKPDGQILGSFEGRTDVEIFEQTGDWTRLRAPIVDGGGFVEGWVRTANVKLPVAKEPRIEIAKAPSGSGDKPAGPKAPAEPKAPATGKPAEPKTGGATAAPAAPPPPKAAPVAAKKAGEKGPDDIKLVPIAGTAKKRPATPFTHKKHYDDYSVACAVCHHPVKAKGGQVPSYTCSSAGCHTADACNGATVGPKNKPCPFFEDAFHIQCIDCHRKDGGPTKCAECHTG